MYETVPPAKNPKRFVGPYRWPRHPGHPANELYSISEYPGEKLRIDVTRSLDLVSLVFWFEGYKLDKSRYRLSQQTDPRITIQFPVQHIAERVFAKPVDDKGEHSCGKPGSEEWVPYLRAAPPTELVFYPKPGKKYEPNLALDKLLDISNLKLVVDRRADLAAGADLIDELRILIPLDDGENEEGWLERVSDIGAKDWQKALGDLFRPERGPHTKLNLSDKLVFSTTANARWKMFPNSEHVNAWKELDGIIPAWSARLEPHSRDMVRAIHSRLFDAIPDGQAVPNSELLKCWTDPDMALTARHHWDIVAQTSLYGLPALLSVKPETDDAGGEAKSEQTVDGLESEGAPRSRVVLPPVTFKVISEHNGKIGANFQDTGFALTKPFDRVHISLQALGANTDMRWKGEPPLLLLKDFDGAGKELEFEGFDLESLQLMTHLGRDTRIEAKDKGYLFPLGIRVTLITVVERHIYLNHRKQPASFAIKRRYIVANDRTKLYTGPYHPYDARAFPATSAAMKTRSTPDLFNCENVFGDEFLDYTIFWPRIARGDAGTLEKNGGVDFEFAWKTNDGVARSNLIFVANSKLTKPDVMRRLVGKYNDSVPEARRTARFDGVRHSYAPANKIGDTSFNTHSWVLEATGRMDGPNGSEHFLMDGRMEGSDQPPFYPRMKSARISIQAVDQIMAESQGHVTVGFYNRYVLDGFTQQSDDRAAPKARDNPSEIFLEVLESEVTLKAGDRADRTGGIASPIFDVAAMSRVIGLVGGTEKTEAVSVNGEAKYRFDNAANGEFNLKEYFKLDAAGNTLGKIFGFFRIGDLVIGNDVNGNLPIDHPNVPRVTEKLTFGLRNSDFFRDAVDTVIDYLYGRNGVNGEIKVALRRADSRLPTGLTMEMLLGKELFGVIQQLTGDKHKHFEEILNELKANPNVETIEATKRFFDDFLDAAEGFIEDPVPDEIVQTIEMVRKFGDEIRNVTLVTSFIGALTSKLKEELEDAFCDVLQQSEYAGVLFGEYGYTQGRPKNCEELFEDPGSALHALGEGLLHGAIDNAVDEIWEKAEPYLLHFADIAGRVEYESTRLKAQVKWAVVDALLAVADKLEPYIPGQVDLRDEELVEELVEKVFVELKGLIESVFAEIRQLRIAEDKKPADPIAMIEQRIASLSETGRKKLRELLGQVAHQVRPLPDGDKHELAAELADDLHKKIIHEKFVTPLKKQLDRVRQSASVSADNAIDAVETITDTAIALIEASAVPGLFSDLHAVATQVQTAVLQLADESIAAEADLAQLLQDVKDAADSLPNEPWVGQIRAEVLVRVGRVENAHGQFATCRQAMQNAAGNFDPALLESMSASLRARARLIAEVAELLAPLRSGGATFARVAPLTTDLTGAVKAFLEAVYPITDTRWDWSRIEASVENIVQLADQGDAVKYVEQLEDAVAASIAKGQALGNALQATDPSDPSTLYAIANKEGLVLLKSIDEGFAGKLLQSVILAESQFRAIGQQAEAALVRIWSGNNAPIFAKLSAVQAIVKKVHDIVQAAIDDPLVGKLLGIIMKGDSSRLLGALDKAFESLDKLILELAKLDNANPADFMDKLTEVRRAFEANRVVLKELDDEISKIDIQDSMGWVGIQLGELLDELKEELEQLVLSFIPTKVETMQNWRTLIKGFENVLEPKQSLPFGHVEDGQQIERHHLHIRSHFQFDLADQSLTTTITGKMAAFDLHIFGKSGPNIATVNFGTCAFKSVNGSSPDYNMPIKGVTPGKLIEFLEPLQRWLSPQGNGFYVKPIFYEPGVEAGYVYSAGLIQLGSLQFINLSLGISASIFFTGKEVQYAFNLGTEELPFMVANPPYGGGGYIKLFSNAGGENKFDVSIFFGGIAALKFGPLSATGRIVAGFTAKKAGQNTNFTAYFEAVGQGSIACFSLTVSLGILLTQEGNGRMYGQTSYYFEFSIGIVEYGYGVNARQSMSNGSSSSKLLAGKNTGTNPTAAIIQNVPAKQKRWRDYARNIDIEVLE